MQAIIHQWAFNGSFDQLVSLPRQELVNDWFGYDVEPSAEFTFATDGQYLWFLAARNREATVHPDARPGQFQPELWRYDLAEWFLASGEGTITGNSTSPPTEPGGPAPLRMCAARMKTFPLHWPWIPNAS